MSKFLTKPGQKVEFSIGPAGHGRIVVGGVDLSSHVRRIVITAEVSQATTVELTLIANELEGTAEGLVDLAQRVAVPA